MGEFEQKATETLSSIQNSLAKVIGHFGDPAVIRPVDLCSLLELDMNLAWKTSRLVNSADLFSTGKYLPGRKALLTLMRKAEKAGIDRESIDSLQKASSKLEILIRTYAGSRKELEVMLAGLSTEERAGNDTVHRRKSFEGNSYTFGLQSDVQLSTNILLQSVSNPELVDICRIRGHVGLYSTRKQVPWRVASTYILDSKGAVMESPSREFLSPVIKGEPPVLKRFSSENLPGFGSVTDNSGKTSYYLNADGIGIRSSTTIFTAEVLRNTGPLYRVNPDDGAALNNSSKTPARKMVVEVYFPEQFAGCPYEVEMWSMLYPTRDYTGMTPGDRLPLSEQPTLYKSGRSAVPLSGIPVYTDMINSCFQKLGYDIRNFSLLRLIMDYPPIPASIDFLMGLPERPKQRS